MQQDIPRINSGWNATSMLNLIAIMMFLAVACAPLTGWANSNIAAVFNSKYPGSTSCNSCHVNGSGGDPNQDSEYARRLYSQLGSPSNVGGLSGPVVSRAMDQIESFFAGKISTLQARDSGGGLLETVVNPDGDIMLPAETARVRVLFGLTTRPFFTSIGGDGTATQGHVINYPGFSGSIGLSISGGSNVFDITLPGPEARRAARQANDFPYALDFHPVTSFGFTNTDGGDSSNSFNIETDNIPPVALADTFDPALLEVQDSSGNPVPYELKVLAKGRDSDPDHAGAALTVSPVAPAISPAYGTVAVNATNTGYVYTAPATLDAVPRPVTFSYTAEDEEGGVSTPVTVTINVPAAAPPQPPKSFVANNDLFVVAEGSSPLRADVKTDNGSGPDNLDGAALSDVTFTISQVPSEGKLTMGADGTFDFIFDENLAGDVSFTYRLSDGTSFDNAVATIRVTPANDLPVVAPITLISVNEARAAFTANLLDPSKISDPDGDALTVQNATFTIQQRSTTAARTIDRSAAVSVTGSSVTIDPTAFSELDNDEFADVTVSYQVSDGTRSVPNTLRVTIIGLDNGLGRQPGAYADTLSDRYVSVDFGPHFEGQSSEPSACLTCHASLATVDADVDTVDECRQEPPVFTAYGLELCLNRSAGTPPLTDLLRRMIEAEPNYVPVLAATDTLQVQQSASAGTPIGDPLTTSTTGRDVFGAKAQIHSYLISRGEKLPPATTDKDGMFRIDKNGQIFVASNALEAGPHTLYVIPVNDAGQRDDKGARISAPGFFSQKLGPESAVTIEVLGDLPTPVDDTINTSVNTSVKVNVLANDTGGDAESLNIVSQPSKGSVRENADLSITYSPATGFVGTDSFTYTSSNTTGAAVDDAIVTVTVVAAEGVVAVNDSVKAIEGRTTLIDVLANDGNARRGEVNATVVSILDRPDPTTEGSVSVSGQSVSFVPAAGFTGTTKFSYRAVNPTPTGNIGSDATVTVSVVAVGQGAIAAAITDPELLKVAQSFEQSCLIVRNAGTLDTESQQFLDVCAALTMAANDSEDLTQAMRALRNEEHFAAVDATAAVARGLGRLISRRLTQLRDGAARGFDTSAITLRISDQIIPTELVAQAARGFLGFRDDTGGKPTWGLFIAGDLAWAERDPNSVSGGYELQANNLMIGYDQVLDDRSLGIALGYSETSTDFAGGGSLDSQGYQVTLYGVQKNFIRRDLSFEGFLSIGRMDFMSDRRINFINGGTTVDTFANAQFDGTYFNAVSKLSYARVLGDYNDPIGALRTATRVTWSTSLDYLWMNLDDYTETGGNGLGLNVQSESYESLIVAVGLDASRPVYFGPNTQAEIYGGVEIRGELLDRNRTVSSAFAAAGPNAPRFLVSEGGTYGLGAGLEVGTVISLGLNKQIDLNYGYDFAGESLSTQHLSFSYAIDMKRNGSLAFSLAHSFSANGSDRTAAELDYRLRF